MRRSKTAVILSPNCMRAATLIAATGGLLACKQHGNPSYEGPHLVLPRELAVTEGSSTTFTAGLDVGEESFAAPVLDHGGVLVVTPMSIALSSSAPSQDFTITAPVDTDDVDGDPVFVDFYVPGTIAGESPNIRTRIVDIDKPNYVASSWNLIVPARGSVTVDVWMTQWPKDPYGSNEPRRVGVQVGGDDEAHVLVSPSVLVFGSGDYNVPQTITVTRIDDTFLEGTYILLWGSGLFWDATISVVAPYSELMR
jgi:hypothetical protein